MSRKLYIKKGRHPNQDHAFARNRCKGLTAFVTKSAASISRDSLYPREMAILNRMVADAKLLDEHLRKYPIPQLAELERRRG